MDGLEYSHNMDPSLVKKSILRAQLLNKKQINCKQQVWLGPKYSRNIANHAESRKK